MDIIKEGNISVNGRVVREPSTDIDPQRDDISMGSKLIQAKAYSYIMLNKPTGYVTTKADKFAKYTIYDLIPKKFHHLVPVGRLDKNTEGLLLLTNDGDFTHRLTHPGFNLDKTYFVVTRDILKPQALSRLEKGIVIEGKKTSPARIGRFRVRKNYCEFYFVIHEGKKRQIRRMVEKVGSKVTYLKRVAQGEYKLGTLKVGEWKSIKP